MTFKKILGAAFVATLAMSVVATSASAHDPKKHRSPGGIFPALLAPVGVAAAVGTTATSFSWTTIAMKTWSFPWAHGPGKFGFFTGNYVPQGVHATGKYISNVLDPKYFGETLHISNPHQASGTHSTSAKYKHKHTKSGSSKKAMGKAVVGCIMGSAFGAITASIRKASALGNPPRWRSQAEHERIVASGYEKQFELTSDEASTALALCGLGSFALHWERRPRP